MYKRWIGSLSLGLLFLVLCTHPSVARLNEGNFITFSQAMSGAADKQAQVHIIQKGDTLYRVAERYDINLDSLMQINNMNEKSILEIGTILKVPISSGQICMVVPGDTISSLAERYQVSVEAFLAANPDKDCDDLVVGEQLTIPDRKSKSVPASNLEASRSISLPGMMAWPIEGTISSPYGWRASGFHHGLDIANKIGTQIHAAAAGKVSFAGYKPIYGRTVIIDHAGGRQTLYAHTQDIYVKVGDRVYTGQTIATVGISGITTGPHVHFEVRVGNKVSNPLAYLRR